MTITVTQTGATSATMLTLMNAATGAPITVAPALPQAMSGTADTFTYAFTEPSAGLLYAYTYQYTIGSVTTLASAVANGSAGATSRYCTQSDLEYLFGVQNIAKWSDMDNQVNPVANVARIQYGMNLACAQEDMYWTGSIYAVPLQLGSNGTRVAAYWVGAKVGIWLYRNRGFGRDDNTQEAMRMAGFSKAIDAERSLYRSGIALQLDAAMAAGAAPTAPTTVPFGSSRGCLDQPNIIGVGGLVW